MLNRLISFGKIISFSLDECKISLPFLLMGNLGLFVVPNRSWSLFLIIQLFDKVSLQKGSDEGLYLISASFRVIALHSNFTYCATRKAKNADFVYEISVFS